MSKSETQIDSIKIEKNGYMEAVKQFIRVEYENNTPKEIIEEHVHLIFCNHCVNCYSLTKSEGSLLVKEILG